MRRSDVVLLGALVASNIGWAAYALTGRRDPAPNGVTAEAALPPAAVPEAPRPATPRAHPPELAAPASARTTTSGGEGDVASPPARATSRPEGPPPRPRAAAGPTAGAPVGPVDDAARRLKGWKEDVLQIEDAKRREEGLDAIEAALRSTDPTTAAGALRSLYDLRDVPYDKQRFRHAVLSRLDDGDARVREAAAFALMQVKPEDRDVDRLLDALAAHPDGGSRGLVVAAWLSKNRVEGRLADAFVRALGVEDARAAVDAANALRGMWVTSEVEDAVLAAWRRTKDDPAGGLWNHILGQITPTREPRVQAIFEILEADRTDAPQLLDRALDARSLDTAAKPLAVRLALEGLPKAPNSMIRTLFLRVVRDHGTLTDVPTLRAFAANSMVGEEVRRAATEAADAIERRR